MDERIQVLCATMHQKDFSKLTQMNINDCDVIFANQNGQYSYMEQENNGYSAKIISTNTIGVGKNRNIALLNATGDILVFADDDLVYEDNFVDIIRNAFRGRPDADLMVFGLKYAKNGKVYRKKVPKEGKLKYLKSLRYGTCAIAVRKKAVLKHNLHFSELFGGGCLYSYGEDTDFITQCFNARMKMYASNKIIGTTIKDTSTCFAGYGKKYYFDKGALARHSLGVFAFPYMIRMALKRVETDLSFAKKIDCLFQGYRCFDQLISYEEWEEK